MTALSLPEKGLPPKVRRRLVDDEPVYVADGLFEPDVVRMIFETCRHLPFTLSDYDTDATSHILHWKHEFKLQALSAFPPLRLWHDAIVSHTRALFAERTLFLERVHCNKHPHDDVQLAHHDIEPGVTSVYFVNPDWSDDWQGEMVFYDRDGEAHSMVSPHPGRVVTFSGGLLHRGGVPSRLCPEARLSIAFKFGAA